MFISPTSILVFTNIVFARKIQTDLFLLLVIGGTSSDFLRDSDPLPWNKYANILVSVNSASHFNWNTRVSLLQHI